MMQANWSLILNILLLIGVVIAIGCLVKTRRQSFKPRYQPTLEREQQYGDDIIAVRQVSCNVQGTQGDLGEITIRPISTATKVTEIKSEVKKEPEKEQKQKVLFQQKDCSYEEEPSLMMFLLAKENRNIVGYELLQSVLSVGFRFGEGHLFHRHQHVNGQGPILFSLAAATERGVFDLQNMGTFKARGLCLYMHISGNTTIDADRFSIMLTTAKQLSEHLDTHLLDERKQPLSDVSLARYNRLLSVNVASYA